MILYRWQGTAPGTAPNFGDELNTILWPRLLPGFFDDDPGVRFLGIGSVLDARHPRQPMKLVAGSGYGGYEPKAVLDRSWVIHWVRGPRTAAALGLPTDLGLGDPAVLLPLVHPLPAPTHPTFECAAPDHFGTNGLAAERHTPEGHTPEPQTIGFMPHFESIARGTWTLAAELAGMTLIDPREPPLQVLLAIRRCRLLLSEALHGVIVADALRVPWIAVRPLAAVHRPKWIDWSDTMHLTLRARTLPASSAREWIGVSRIGSSHRARAWLQQHGSHLDAIAPRWLVERAADALRRAADEAPQLSAATVLDRCQARMMDAVTALRRQPLRGSALLEHDRPRLPRASQAASALIALVNKT